MPCLKLLRPLATSPIIDEKRFPPNKSSRMIARIRICQMLRPPITETPLAVYLVALLFAFQLKLEHRLVERVQKSRRLQVIDPGQVTARGEAEVGQELLRGRIEQRPAGPLAPPSGTYPAGVHQHVERALGDLHTADRFNFGAADRLMIRDDRQR